MSNIIGLYDSIENKIRLKSKKLFKIMDAEYLFFDKKTTWVGYESQKKTHIWGHFDFYVSAKMHVTREYTPQELRLYAKTLKSNATWSQEGKG